VLTAVPFEAEMSSIVAVDGPALVLLVDGT